MTETDWQIIISRDGAVLGVGGGAPESLVGTQWDGRAASIGQASAQVTVVDAVPIRRTPTDLRAVLASALTGLQPQAKAHDVTLRIVVDDDVPPHVPLDAPKIGWAITMLVGNALRFVERGSRLLPGGSIRVLVKYDATRREVTIVVQDDGCGMAPQMLRRLFASASGGPVVGLGLSMVRDVMVAHGGRFDVASETEGAGRGTTIRLTLPVAWPKPNETPSPRST
jgi:signal transduction histidine kinase